MFLLHNLCEHTVFSDTKQNSWRRTTSPRHRVSITHTHFASRSNLLRSATLQKCAECEILMLTSVGGIFFLEKAQHVCHVYSQRAWLWPNVDLLSAHRRRRWSNIKSALVQCIVLADQALPSKHKILTQSRVLRRWPKITPSLLNETKENSTISMILFSLTWSVFYLEKPSLAMGKMMWSESVRLQCISPQTYRHCIVIHSKNIFKYYFSPRDTF